MEIHDLSTTDTAAVIEAFREAFSDYAVGFSREEIASMLTRRGYYPELSFAAFENGKIAAFSLNGAGMLNGEKAVYDCATGTLPQFRAQGLAGEIFNHALPVLRRAGITRYILEVLKSNTTAISLYRRNGFEVTADYDCFRADISDLSIPTKEPSRLTIRDILPDELRKMEHFCDFVPSWQNSMESIVRGWSSLIVKGAYLNGEAAGCCVFDPCSGDIARIATAPGHRRIGIASALLTAMARLSQSSSMKVLNVDATTTTLPNFLRAVNFQQGLSQYAMTRPI